MKQIFKPLTIVSAIALLMLVTGCATTETAKTDMLSAAGFKLVTADTPQKLELLKSLPAGQLSKVTFKGKTFYVQPASTPNQAYVGTPTEYQAYQQARLEQKMTNDNLMAAQMNADAMARWNSWGPSFYGGFYGPRF
jgi:hypothetical protein